MKLLAESEDSFSRQIEILEKEMEEKEIRSREEL
jgi:hypothetical protein